VWNASTIAGSRTRRNGILQNELYASQIIWNRQTFIKDPETGKRISRANSPDKWMTADAAHVRIVDQETWDPVQERRSDRAGTPHKTRPKHLLSGLMKCGTCGSGYIACGTDKRGTLLMCSRNLETGLCDNGKRVPRDAVEDRFCVGSRPTQNVKGLCAPFPSVAVRPALDVNATQRIRHCKPATNRAAPIASRWMQNQDTGRRLPRRTS
jgi:site-specific DNA recombinase